MKTLFSKAVSALMQEGFGLGDSLRTNAAAIAEALIGDGVTVDHLGLSSAKAIDDTAIYYGFEHEAENYYVAKYPDANIAMIMNTDTKRLDDSQKPWKTRVHNAAADMRRNVRNEMLAQQGDASEKDKREARTTRLFEHVKADQVKSIADALGKRKQPAGGYDNVTVIKILNGAVSELNKAKASLAE